MKKYEKKLKEISYLDSYKIIDNLLDIMEPHEILIVLSKVVHGKGLKKQAGIIHKASTRVSMV